MSAVMRARRPSTASSLHTGGPASFRDQRVEQSLLFPSLQARFGTTITIKFTDMTTPISEVRRLARAEYGVCFWLLRQSARSGTMRERVNSCASSHPHVIPKQHLISHLTFTHDGNVLLVGSKDGHIVIYFTFDDVRMC
jgi:WD40 repeat protein